MATVEVAVETVARGLDGGLLTMRCNSSFGPSGSVGVTVEVDEVFSTYIGFADSMLAIAQASEDYREVSTAMFPDGGATVRYGTGLVRSVDLGFETWAPQTHLVWEGAAFAVAIHDSLRSAPEMRARLDKFVINETPEGIRLELPSGRAVSWIKFPSILSDIEGSVQLEVTPLTKVVAGRLPTYRGTAVAGGELYVSRHGASGDSEESAYFTLVSDTAVAVATTIPGCDIQRAIDDLAGLELEWSQR